MPRDGGGTYTLPAGNPVIPGTIIDTTWANPTMDDIAAALTDSLSRTGSGGMIVPFLNADGVVNLPGISWANQQNMGFYRPGLDEMRVSVAANDKARWTSSATDPYELFVGAAWVPVLHESGDYTLTGNWDFSGAASFDYFAPIFLGEQNVANPFVAAFGQFWVRDDAPNIPMFTDDLGTDTPFVIAVPTISSSTLRGAGGTYIEERTVHILAAGGGIQIFDSTETHSLVIAHDGVDVNFFGFGVTADWNIGSLTGRVNIDAGLSVTTGLEIFDAVPTESVLMEINSTTMAPAPAFVFIESAAIEVYSFNEPINIDNGSLHVSGIGRGLEFWRYGDAVGSSITIETEGPRVQVIGVGQVFHLSGGTFSVDEEAAAAGDVAGRGQFWVRNDVPNTPMFTDDAGTDFVLNAGGGGGGGNFNGALAYRAPTQSIPTAVFTTMLFTSEAYDTDNIHDNVTNPNRLTTPAGVTKIRLKGGLQFVANVTGVRLLRIRKNGIGTSVDDNRTAYQPQVTFSPHIQGSFNQGTIIMTGILHVDTGDWFELQCYQTSGGFLNTVGGGRDWLEMEIIE